MADSDNVKVAPLERGRDRTPCNYQRPAAYHQLSEHVSEREGPASALARQSTTVAANLDSLPQVLQRRRGSRRVADHRSHLARFGQRGFVARVAWKGSVFVPDVSSTLYFASKHIQQHISSKTEAARIVHKYVVS